MEVPMILLLALCIVPSQQVQRCLLSREDYLTCKYQNSRLIRAGHNQYSVHYTRLRESSSGYLECNVRASEQIVSDITSLGTQEMRVLYSPGFINQVQRRFLRFVNNVGTEPRYDDQLRTENLVQCQSNELAFFNMTHLNIQGPEDCQDDNGNNKCQDYVQIIRDTFGTTDVCGNETSMTNAVLELEFGDYTVVFRSSESIRGEGFEMYSLCFIPAERDLPDCFQESEFNTGVCAPSGQSKRAAVKKERNADNDIEDSEEVATAYSDLFPGYPAHLKMANDLARFEGDKLKPVGFDNYVMGEVYVTYIHHQWHRIKRKAGAEVIAEDILYNQTVNYTGNSIFVFDQNNKIVAKHDGVLVLQTFDRTGSVGKHVGRVTVNKNPHFFGAGPLRILGRHAFFQLFVIDPRGLIPNREEQNELITMNTPLLDSVPPGDDVFFTDGQQQLGDLSKIPGIAKRQAGSQLTDVDQEAVLAALRSTEACNPVLRAQSRATLAYYTGINATFVEDLRTFEITCSLSDSVMLSCTSVNTTLPGRTMCQVDNETSFQCEPFSAPVNLTAAPSISVTVTAINCVGQTAEVMTSCTNLYDHHSLVTPVSDTEHKFSIPVKAPLTSMHQRSGFSEVGYCVGYSDIFTGT